MLSAARVSVFWVILALAPLGVLKYLFAACIALKLAFVPFLISIIIPSIIKPKSLSQVLLGTVGPTGDGRLFKPLAIVSTIVSVRVFALPETSFTPTP